MYRLLAINLIDLMNSIWLRSYTLDTASMNAIAMSIALRYALAISSLYNGPYNAPYNGVYKRVYNAEGELSWESNL